LEKEIASLQRKEAREKALARPAEAREKAVARPAQAPANAKADGPVIAIPGIDPEKAILDQKVKGVVPVFFQTNRKIKDGAFSLEQVTFERSQTPTFGVVRVLPKETMNAPVHSSSSA
jgi:hypothetical protein